MRQALLDTSFLQALVLRRDQYHDAAIAVQRAYSGRLVMTEYVLVELHGGRLCDRRGRRPHRVGTLSSTNVSPQYCLSYGLSAMSFRRGVKMTSTHCRSFGATQA
jgi:hypothetical protein